MAGPWEKYQSTPSRSPSQEAVPPWEKYASGSKPVEESSIAAKSHSSGEAAGLIGGIAAIGSAIDSVSGAPTRAAIGAIQDGKNPFSAFGKQFADDPSLAPTGKEIAAKMGVSTQNNEDILPADFYDVDFSSPFPATSKYQAELTRKVSPAGTAGLGIDIAADPLNIIPVGQVLKTAGKGVKAGVGAATDVAVHGVRRVPGVPTIEATAKAVKEGAASTADALKRMFTPVQASDFKSLSTTAKKYGIPEDLLPEAIEFGENSFISRAARNRAEGPLGEPHLQRFERGLEAVRDATENHIARIGGGSVPGPVEAGEIIRSGFDKGVDRIFNSVGMTHNKVMEAIPNLALSPKAAESIQSKLNGLEKWAVGRSQRGFTNAQRGQAEQVLRAIEAVRAGNGSYKQTVEALRDIGEVAFKSQNTMADIPPDIAKFRDLYGTLNEALIDTVSAAAGKPVADELIQSNKIISDFFGDKSVVSGIIGNKSMAPERVFAALIEQGDTKKIQALKNILPPEEFQKLKGAFLGSQIRRTADDTFTFKSLHNNLRNKKNIVGEILDPREIDEIGELIRLGDRFGNPILSTSGTGASGLFSNLSQGIRSGLESDAVVGLLKEQARNRTQKALTTQSTQAASKGAKSTAAPVKGAGAASRVAGASAAAARTTSIHNQTENTEPNRGPEKWAREGVKRLIDAGVDQESAEALLKTKAGKDLLIEASEASKDSARMKSVLKRIKSASTNGGE